MNASTALLLLAMGLASAQLNFEGNPLTEDTEYTAEESRLSLRTARNRETTENVTNGPPDHLNLDPEKSLIDTRQIDQDKITSLYPISPKETVQTARHLSTSTPIQGTESVDRSELALNTFLNSKTPEESRLSLHHYLQTRDPSQNTPVQAQPSQQTVSNQQQLTRQQLTQQQLTQQQMAPYASQQLALSSPVNQHLTAQLMQQRQAFPVNQRQQFIDREVNGPANPQDLQPVANPIAVPPMHQQQPLQQAPYAAGLQARNDMYYPGWYNRMRRVRGKPHPFAQSRGGPGFYNGPVPGPFKPKAPVEVIYTKPPGFHRAPPPLSNPPVPYEDASAWFPNADHPPPSKDVYYSQLYAQSYDPHYYNYIAKTGKIKPHLYGKLGKYGKEEDEGIWSELFKGFKKHGLKNIMTPTFLLGMTLPVVTLMLTALVQKRSLARSDSGDFPREETIQEYMEQLQRAVECYERKRRRGDESLDGC